YGPFTEPYRRAGSGGEEGGHVRDEGLGVLEHQGVPGVAVDDQGVRGEVLLSEVRDGAMWRSTPMPVDAPVTSIPGRVAVIVGSLVVCITLIRP
ncbi:hypothetical protein, partial [Paractinoplanes toevensis]|uniref:hypothetical protein n=1 Tax=Paractinoplanes toevensis TaxID=571911 RepID=UPI001BB3A47C